MWRLHRYFFAWPQGKNAELLMSYPQLPRLCTHIFPGRKKLVWPCVAFELVALAAGADQVYRLVCTTSTEWNPVIHSVRPGCATIPARLRIPLQDHGTDLHGHLPTALRSKLQDLRRLPLGHVSWPGNKNDRCHRAPGTQWEKSNKALHRISKRKVGSKKAPALNCTWTTDSSSQGFKGYTQRMCFFWRIACNQFLLG